MISSSSSSFSLPDCIRTRRHIMLPLRTWRKQLYLVVLYHHHHLMAKNKKVLLYPNAEHNFIFCEENISFFMWGMSSYTMYTYYDALSSFLLLLLLCYACQYVLDFCILKFVWTWYVLHAQAFRNRPFMLPPKHWKMLSLPSHSWPKFVYQQQHFQFHLILLLLHGRWAYHYYGTCMHGGMSTCITDIYLVWTFEPSALYRCSRYVYSTCYTFYSALAASFCFPS